jgi:hypothetical protein
MGDFCKKVRSQGKNSFLLRVIVNTLKKAVMLFGRTIWPAGDFSMIFTGPVEVQPGS